MALTISAASAAPPLAAKVAPAPVARATAPPAPPSAAGVARAAQPAAVAAAPRAQQQAALNQLLTKYKYGQSHNAAAGVLSSLGRQILSEAKTLGQHVTLPRAPAGAGVAAPAPEAHAAAAAGRVSITA